MAKTEFENLGNDRYFKYRYAEETPVNFSTWAESWESKKCASFYKIMEDYLKRSLNIKLIYDGHKVSFSDLSKLYTAPLFFNKANIIAHTVSSSFFHDQQENFSPSPVLETAKTIIVSAAPKRVLLSSMSFLNTNSPVVILTVSTVVLLSLLLVIYSIVTNKFRSIPTKKAVKKLAQETLEKVWENAALLCA